MIKPIDTKMVVQRAGEYTKDATLQTRQGQVKSASGAHENYKQVEREMKEVVETHETEGNVIDKDGRQEGGTSQEEYAKQKEEEQAQEDSIEEQMEVGTSDTIIDIRV